MLDSLVRVSRRVLKLPKAIASQIGVSYEVYPRSPTTNSRTGTESALGPIAALASNVLVVGRTLTEVAASRHLYTVERVGRDTAAFEHESPKRSHTDSAASRRPTPDGSRRPTRGKVHAFDASSTNERLERRERRSSLDRSSPTPENANEFPLSTFRVSQVYP